MTIPASGIYKITNIYSGKVYVGQSKNIFKRRMQHFSELERGTHKNAALQADWNKSGGKGFRWEVIEYCSIEKLNEREQYWITTLNTFAPHGYNQGWEPYKRHKELPPKPPHYKQKHYHKTR